MKEKYSPNWDLKSIPAATWKKELQRRKKEHGHGGSRPGAGKPAKKKKCRRCGAMVTGPEERHGHGDCQPKRRK